LFVAGPHEVLAALRDAVEVIAAQAALALERIALTDAVSRHQSDASLHTVMRNTTDVVVVIDDEHRVRWASQSLATVLGTPPPAFGMLCDLFHPEDHDQVRRTLELARQAPGPEGAADSWSLRRPDGTRVLVEVRCRDRRRDRMVQGFVITMRDVTAQRRHEQEGMLRALRSTAAGQNCESLASKFRPAGRP
jgi:PAS domain S-box-containing protein